MSRAASGDTVTLKPTANIYTVLVVAGLIAVVLGLAVLWSIWAGVYGYLLYRRRQSLMQSIQTEAVTDPIPPSKKAVVRRKTLQLSFKRLGDKYLMKSEAIRFMPPAQWLYRASQLDLTLDKVK